MYWISQITGNHTTSPYTSAHSVCDTLLSEPETSYYKSYNNYNQSDYYYYQQLNDFQLKCCRSTSAQTRRWSSRELRNRERSLRLLPTGSCNVHKDAPQVNVHKNSPTSV